MSTTPTEAAVTKKCVALLRRLKKGGVPVEWLKVHGSGMQRAGEPDMLIVLDGQAFHVEIKRPGGKTTRLQDHRLEQWRKAGSIVGVVRSADELAGLLRPRGCNVS